MPAGNGSGNWRNSDVRRTAAGQGAARRMPGQGVERWTPPGQSIERRMPPSRSAARRPPPGSSLIEGGFGNRANARHRTRSQDRQSTQGQARHSTRGQTHRTRSQAATAPLLLTLALALTLGIILALSSGSPTVRVNQRTAGTSATSSPRP